MSGDRYWQTAQQVCTPLELQTLELRDRRHMGSRLIALHLGVSRAAIRERLDNADRKIKHALEKETAA